MSIQPCSGRLPSRTLLSCIFLLAGLLPLAAQVSSGEFEYYYLNKDSGSERHTIFVRNSNVTERVESGSEVAHTFAFTQLYDSLFRLSPVSFRWDVSLPDGAFFDPARRYLYWQLGRGQLDDYLVKVRVRYGDIVDSVVMALRVEENWKSTLIPGSSYIAYVPADRSAYGMFNGVSIEYLLVSWVARNQRRGPSHGQVYLRFDVMQSSDPAIPPGFFYTTGVNLSLERKPTRLFAVPFFGAEFGGMYNREWGNIFQFTPVAGLWLYADQTNTISLSGGYVLPSTDYERLRGFRLMAGGTFSLW